jgi:hypothetical protein
MIRRVGLSLLFATWTACSVGGGGGPDTGGPGTGSEDHNMTLGIVCNSAFKITGTFTAGTPGRPTDETTGEPITGCWPIGTWTFTASVDTENNECTPAPTVLAGYSFRVDGMDDGDGIVRSYMNLGALGDLQYHLSVSSNGQGCEGNFEIGSADGKQYWNLQPVLPNDAPAMIAGHGDYSLYNADAWPWK